MTAWFPHLRPPAQQCLTLAVWAVLFGQGCSSRGQLELLEAEIRQHQDALRQAQTRTSELESQLSVAHRESNLLRQQMAESGAPVPLPEQTAAIARLSGLKINTLLSGGKDRDGQPGDDVLVALVTPLDEQGDLVKIAGDVEIEAFDLTRQGDDKRVGHWKYSLDQSAQAWHSGFVGAGLQFELPWQVLPAGRELVVHARLRTPDGRQFDTSTPLKVDPPVAAMDPGSPSTIQPVKHEQPVNRELLRSSQPQVMTPVRPVPEYEDPIAPADVKSVPLPFPTDLGGTAPAPIPGHAELDGVQTSDNWTDETIPRLR